MITIEEALTANEFHYGTCTYVLGPRGGRTIHQYIYRRSGKTKTWKTRPGEFRIPIKHGLYYNAQLTHEHAQLFHTPEQCPLRELTDSPA